ncbi:MAG: ArsR/SmtB family transcription factor [Alphaproteobacteria bacterium]
MAGVAVLAKTESLIADPARAGMLTALMDRKALTSGELARVAGIAPQTADDHLACLTAAGLLSTFRQGRHRYYRLASADAARLLKDVMAVSTGRRRTVVTGPRGAAMRAARTCYGHLAGTLGVRIADGLVERGYIELSQEAGVVTKAGVAFFADFGIGIDAEPRSGKRVFCRLCLDWSERVPHIGGTLGAALATRCFALGWIERVPASRAVAVTEAGRQGFAERFGIAL